MQTDIYFLDLQKFAYNNDELSCSLQVCCQRYRWVAFEILQIFCWSKKSPSIRLSLIWIPPWSNCFGVTLYAMAYSPNNLTASLYHHLSFFFCLLRSNSKSQDCLMYTYAGVREFNLFITNPLTCFLLPCFSCAVKWWFRALFHWQKTICKSPLAWKCIKYSLPNWNCFVCFLPETGIPKVLWIYFFGSQLQFPQYQSLGLMHYWSLW